MQPATESENRARRRSNPRWFWHSAARDPSGGTAEPREGRFVSYPTKRVVGTIADATNAEAAVDALLQAGFEREAIEVLQGERGLHRLDPTGAEHGLLAHFQRRLIQFAGDLEELSLKRFAEDVRAGKLVVMVLAKKRQTRNMAADILNAHGAEYIGYFSRWFWESLDAGRASPAAATVRDPAIGQTYEASAGPVTHLQFQSAAAATVTVAGRAISRAAVVPIRPGVRMLSWKDAHGLPVVHVHDYETGRAFAVVAQRDGSLRNFTGTVRRLT
jgi:hypothetical protein